MINIKINTPISVLHMTLIFGQEIMILEIINLLLAG